MRDPQSFIGSLQTLGKDSNFARDRSKEYGKNQEQTDFRIEMDAWMDWWLTLSSAKRLRNSEGLTELEWQGLLSLIQERQLKKWPEHPSVRLRVDDEFTSFKPSP
jgi:hypothetical protein